MRDLTLDERGVLMELWYKTNDWSVFNSARVQVESLLNESRALSSVELIVPVAKTGLKNDKVFYIEPTQRLQVIAKFNDDTTLSVSLEKYFQVKSAMVLAGWEKDKKMAEEPWYVYVVRCADSTLYCGCTKDVKRRVGEHNGSPRGAKYTRSRRPVSLLKSWKLPNQSEAVKAEIRFKDLPKSEKERIVKG